jgi:hypothetical protein
MDKVVLHNKAVSFFLRSYWRYQKISDFVVEKDGEKFTVITNFPKNKNTGNISFNPNRIEQMLRDDCIGAIIVHCFGSDNFEVFGITTINDLAKGIAKTWQPNKYGYNDYKLAAIRHLNIQAA